jgi:hypothetical protein
MSDVKQALQMETTNVQLAILPTFSNDPKEDRTFATEWLQKLMNYKQGGGLLNLQTVTHFRNALRGKVLKWYNALLLLDVESLNWVEVRTQFKQHFRGTPTISSVIQK